MFLFFIGVVVVCSHAAIIYEEHQHSVKRLTAKHTFLEQCCIPDEHLNRTVEYVVVHVSAFTIPTQLEITSTQVATRTTLTYKTNVTILLQFWAEIYNVDIDSNNNTASYIFPLKNATATKLVAPSHRADCVEIRYYASFLGNENHNRVDADYTLDVYWIVQ